MKPRVIIADTDPGYLFSLQARFAEEFYDRADLEIISDRAYFQELFLMPQKADVLVVADELYDESLKRHNINFIFVLTEQNAGISGGTVSSIYKYSSVRNILNEIVSRSGGLLSSAVSQAREPKIVAVCSAKGGTGKTTVALGLCAGLARSFKRVLYIGADHLQSFQRLLENPGTISSNDVYMKLSRADEKIYGDVKHVIRSEGFSYFPPFAAPLESLNLGYDVYRMLAVSAKHSEEYDFVIVDADSVLDNDKMNLLEIADRVVVVMRQEASAVFATDIMMSSISGAATEKFLYVCCGYRDDADNAITSAGRHSAYSTVEYVRYIPGCDQMKAGELGEQHDIQKLAVLLE